jgi:hypothetical protein
MIDIFYTGQNRFSDQTKHNHAWMIDQLRSRFGAVQVHDFLQPEFDRSDCPVPTQGRTSGGVQVWDFMKAAQKLMAPTIMKFRTDLWFCNSSADPVLRSVDRVLSGTVDVSYLGANVKHGFENRDSNVLAQHNKKVPDFVITAKRSAVMGIDRVRDRLSSATDVASGNRVFRIITDDLSRSEITWCHIFLVRDQDTPLTDWHMARDFVRSYASGSSAMQYVMNQNPSDAL